jgi:hypothetical protein
MIHVLLILKSTKFINTLEFKYLYVKKGVKRVQDRVSSDTG